MTVGKDRICGKPITIPTIVRVFSNADFAMRITASLRNAGVKNVRHDFGQRIIAFEDMWLAKLLDLVLVGNPHNYETSEAAARGLMPREERGLALLRRIFVKHTPEELDSVWRLGDETRFRDYVLPFLAGLP